MRIEMKRQLMKRKDEEEETNEIYWLKDHPQKIKLMPHIRDHKDIDDEK